MSNPDNSVTVQTNRTARSHSSDMVHTNDIRIVDGARRTAYYFTQKTCPVCGNEFRAARESCVYDSPKCRQKAKRDRDTLNSRKRTIQKMLRAIERTANSEEKRLALNSIQMVLDGVKRRAG